MARPSGAAPWEVLPTPLRRFTLGRYDVSVRYAPAPSGSPVGGDWYDARLGADGSAVIAIGDVSGHGPVAAAGMVRIGNALRGLSFTGQSANTVLGWLNRVVCADECPERVASAVVCVFDQGRPVLRWAQAGHPPPVPVSGGLARLLAAAARCQRETADDAVIALFGRLEPLATDDDVCVLAVRVN